MADLLADAIAIAQFNGIGWASKRLKVNFVCLS